MTTFLIASQILVFFHIAFGELAGASLLWGVKELIFITPQRYSWLRGSYWIAFGSSMASWLIGGSYYLFFYPQVKPVINAGPEAWAHAVFMEAKEHIFLLVPVLLFLLALFVQRAAPRLQENPKLKNRFLILTLFVVGMIFSIAFMGYMITWGARTALWIQAGA